ncbi:fibroblast growth factor 4 [Ictalurus punctatus]|uniref:Fibroblast growth factor n=1 Tax=Ictalurus punctatus TaxID=7998 RepID=A0A979EVM5_ICTPU|nr:fibroblast growth factor 4 [Ictalurus punctatus]
MDLHWALVCVAVLLSVYVRSERSEMDANRDQASRLRHMWLLSIKESNMRQDAFSTDVYSVGKGKTYQLLYCRVGIGYHLQIQPNGTVRGVHEPTEHSWLKVFAVKPGVVGIHAVKSKLYLCMNNDGVAQGKTKFSADCLFKEHLEENHYTTYSSAAHPGLYLALSHRGHLRRGDSVGPHHASSHFLPRKVTVS